MFQDNLDLSDNSFTDFTFTANATLESDDECDVTSVNLGGKLTDCMTWRHRKESGNSNQSSPVSFVG